MRKVAIFAVAAFGALLVTAPGLAQTRPTLSEAESRIGVAESDLATLQADHAALEAEHDALQTAHDALSLEHARTNAAVCAKADADGDSYRPFVCSARCDCFDAATLEAEACIEVAAGEFEITATTTAATTCLGMCIDIVSGFPSGVRCTAGAQCATGESCYFEWGGSDIGLCGVPSSCSQDSDCDPGYTCSLDGSCVNGPVCASAGDPVCPGAGEPILLASLLGLGSDPDATGVVTCSHLVLSGSSAPYNANDALSCLAAVEAELGAACAYLCGNGVPDPGEGCDDGNRTPGDGCDANCQLEP